MVKLKKIVGRNLSELLTGAAINASVRYLAAIIGFLSSFLVARYFGTAAIGQIATITSLGALGTSLALFGNGTLALRMLPRQKELNGVGGAWDIYLRLVLMSFSGLGGLLLLWLLLENVIVSKSLLGEIEDYKYLIAILVFLGVFRMLNLKTLRGLGDYYLFSIIDIAPSMLRICIIVICILVSIPENLFIQFYFVPVFFICPLSIYFVVMLFRKLSSENKLAPVATEHGIGQNEKQDSVDYISLYKLSLPMFGVTLSSAIIGHADILMLNFYTTAETVGVYAVYVKIVTVSSLVMQAINSMFAPKVAALHAAGQATQLRNFAKRTTQVALFAAIAIFVFVMFIHLPLLGLLGGEFKSDLNALYILLVSSVLSAYFGAAGLFLNMTGGQKYFFWVMLLASILNLLLNALLIPLWGGSGAAFATFIAILLSKVLANIRIKKDYGYMLGWSPWS